MTSDPAPGACYRPAPTQCGRPLPSPAAPSPAAATLITVAPTGAESDKADVPALPVTLDELVATAVECRGGRGGRDPRAHPGRRGAGPPWTWAG